MCVDLLSIFKYFPSFGKKKIRMNNKKKIDFYLTSGKTQKIMRPQNEYHNFFARQVLCIIKIMIKKEQ